MIGYDFKFRWITIEFYNKVFLGNEDNIIEHVPYYGNSLKQFSAVSLLPQCKDLIIYIWESETQ